MVENWNDGYRSKRPFTPLLHYPVTPMAIAEIATQEVVSRRELSFE
jgi:hypothetical protein